MQVTRKGTHYTHITFIGYSSSSSTLGLGFPTGRDSATFRDSGTGKTFLSRDKGTMGQKFLHCPETKGQRDKLKILPRDGTGRDSQNSGRDNQNPGWDTDKNSLDKSC